MFAYNANVDPAVIFLVSMISGGIFLAWWSARHRSPRVRPLMEPHLFAGWFEALGHSFEIARCQSSIWLWRPAKSVPVGSVLVITELGTGRTVRVGAAVKYASDDVYGDRVTDVVDVTVPRETFDAMARLALGDPARAAEPFRAVPPERVAFVHADDEDAPRSNFRVPLVCSENAPEDAWLTVGAVSLAFQSARRSHEREIGALLVRYGTTRAAMGVRPALLIDGLGEQPICIAAPPEEVASGPDLGAHHYSIGAHDWRRLRRALG